MVERDIGTRSDDHLRGKKKKKKIVLRIIFCSVLEGSQWGTGPYIHCFQSAEGMQLSCQWGREKLAGTLDSQTCLRQQKKLIDKRLKNSQKAE